MTTLFDAWMPPWMGCESLYSYCARYHRLTGRRLSSATSQTLFDHPQVGLSHDLPGRLASFADRTGGQLGTAEEILARHTVMGYYLTFMHAATRNQVISRLLTDGPGGLKARMGWLATRFGAAHPLKACNACIADDEREHGIATWRLVHQLPAVWTCPAHEMPLWLAMIKVDGLQRFQWLVPDDIEPRQRRTVIDSTWSVASVQAATAMASDVEAVLAHNGFHAADPIRLSSILLRRMVDLGYTSETGRLRLATVSEAWIAHLNRYRHFPEAEALCVTEDAAVASLRRALKSQDCPLHPLRQLIVIEWLFGSWREFVAAEQEAGAGVTDECTRPTNVRPRVADARRTTLRSLVADRKCSLRSAAQQVGISVNTAVQWAQAMGIEVQRRPKAVGDDVRASIEAALRCGTSKHDIATLKGLSVQTVTRILLASPELVAARRRWQFEHMLEQARRKVQRVASLNPEFGIKRLCECCAAEFTWLRRNDRPWFDSWKAKLPPGQRVRRERVDWSLRDRHFQQQIELFFRNPENTHVEITSRGQILRAVPGLLTKARKLEYMPLTREALESAMANARRMP